MLFGKERSFLFAAEFAFLFLLFVVYEISQFERRRKL